MNAFQHQSIRNEIIQLASPPPFHPYLRDHGSSLLDQAYMCSLCRSNRESTDHSFITYPYIINMWRYASRVRGIHFLWHGPHLVNALSSWLQKDEHTVYLALTVIIIWYVWYVKNLAICEESYVPLEVFSNKALATLDLFPQVNEFFFTYHQISYDKSKCWAFFDGAS